MALGMRKTSLSCRSGAAVRRYCRRAPEQEPEVSQLLSQYVSHQLHPVTLSTLLSFGRPLTPESVLRSSFYAQSELPKRLATRVRAFEALPFIVGTNPYIAKTLNAFRKGFLWLASYPRVNTLEENAVFVSHLEDLVQTHADDIPTMAKGFQECARYMSPAQVSEFLDGTIRNRVSVRLIAEQHIALSHALGNPLPSGTRVGVVDMACSPTRMIQMCGSFVSDLCEASLGASPKIVVDGHPDATFAYIPVHLEYILTEILKNAFRATVEAHYKLHGTVSSESIPPINITISPASVPDHSHRTFLSLRVRDQGGGVAPAHISRIFSYAFTTASHADESGANDEKISAGAAIGSVGGGNMFEGITGRGLRTGIGTIAGLGYGLPMSRLYAKYFGGSLEFVPLDGWGSDVFVKLRCLDEAGGAEI